MPMQSWPHLERFLTRLHRRLIAVRLIEGIALGALCGSLAGLPLAGLLVWRGGSRPIALVISLTVLGAVAGVGRRLARCWPSRLLAAREADRQLGLSDLLASAWSVRRSSSDPWQRSLLAIADDRCRTLVAADVVMRRLGGRAWSGVGLAVALTGALAMLGEGRSSATPVVRNSTDRLSLAMPADRAAVAQRTQQQGGGGPEWGRAADSDASPRNKPPANASNDPERIGSPMGIPAGERESAGRSGVNAPVTADVKKSRSAAGERQTPPDYALRQENVVGGGTPRHPASSNGAADSSSNSSGEAANAEHSALPGSSEALDQVQDSGKTPVVGNDVPAAYRELIRDYFRR